MAKFEKGDGRARKPKGATNKLTRTVKECVLDAFNDLQKDPKVKLSKWGKENPTEFYKIAAKLIPTEVNAQVKQEFPLPDLSKLSKEDLKELLKNDSSGSAA